MTIKETEENANVASQYFAEDIDETPLVTKDGDVFKGGIRVAVIDHENRNVIWTSKDFCNKELTKQIRYISTTLYYVVRKFTAENYL